MMYILKKPIKELSNLPYDEILCNIFRKRIQLKQLILNRLIVYKNQRVYNEVVH